MATPRLLERLLPAMAAEAGISVAELRELMIPVDMDTTADVSSAEDDVSDVEIDADVVLRLLLLPLRRPCACPEGAIRRESEPSSNLGRPMA